ncbi:hypothetical protein DZC73_20505 [Albitalea terrae]|uniref:Uncharacterized protein n=1 Tax=Piscinibacter terrae TaxID=2496871 RepID=A0A3N7JNG3_9BURK|nr:hypothetical protein DZC73_20505 [Albitalea terrae]
MKVYSFGQGFCVVKNQMTLAPGQRVEVSYSKSIRGLSMYCTADATEYSSAEVAKGRIRLEPANCSN